MNFDLKNWMKNRELKVKAKQEELKRLTDDELILLDDDSWASIAELQDEPLMSIWKEYTRTDSSRATSGSNWRFPMNKAQKVKRKQKE